MSVQAIDQEAGKELSVWEKWNRAEEVISELQGLIYALDKLTTESPVFNANAEDSLGAKRHRKQQQHAIISICRQLHEKAEAYDADRASQ